MGARTVLDLVSRDDSCRVPVGRARPSPGPGAGGGGCIATAGRGPAGLSGRVWVRELWRQGVITDCFCFRRAEAHGHVEEYTRSAVTGLAGTTVRYGRAPRRFTTGRRGPPRRERHVQEGLEIDPARRQDRPQGPAVEFGVLRSRFGCGVLRDDMAAVSGDRRRTRAVRVPGSPFVPAGGVASARVRPRRRPR